MSIYGYGDICAGDGAFFMGKEAYYGALLKIEKLWSAQFGVQDGRCLMMVPI